jgi:hypothetical protein
MSSVSDLTASSGDISISFFDYQAGHSIKLFNHHEGWMNKKDHRYEQDYKTDL